MGKPVEFYLKGEGTVALLKKDLKKYLKALTLQEDIICINVDTPKASKIFPIMRKEFSLADPAHMVTGGFKVDRIGETNNFKIQVDGIVSTRSLDKKDLELISSGLVTCKLDYVGTGDEWNFGEDCGIQLLNISIPERSATSAKVIEK